MPSTRHISKQQPSPKFTKVQAQFSFPVNSHLLVTTARNIYAWDRTGVNTIFTSSKSSIVAAREAKDGSGILAVADKRVVVLHDTKRGQGRSWGLNADDDEVRHLEYTADAKLLFLSTNLTTDIQSYSTEQSKLLPPARSHASPPVALAVSGSGHLLVSASDDPPAVYLKYLRQNSEAILLESRASETGVSKIAFHPERPNVFLLAFQDGTVASYDATKISRNRAGSYANQLAINAGEISRIPRLHRTTSQTPNNHSVADAAFLPGYKTRAITVGTDGRCRLIDFGDGGIVLRTWHAKAPVTSISILSRKSEAELRKHSATDRSHMIGGPTSTDNLVAIARTDGKVHLYDSLGLLLDHQVFSKEDEAVIGVEWAKGVSPAPIADSMIAKNVDGLNENIDSGAIPISHLRESQPTPNFKTRRETMFEHVGLPPELRRPQVSANKGTTQPPRRFTIHPDEMDEAEGTVRHNPASRAADPVLVGQKTYLDLFSPTKPPDDTGAKSPAQRLASPPRTRPRVSPQTFIKSPELIAAGQHSTISKQRNLALFPSTDSSSATLLPIFTQPVQTSKISSSRKGIKVTFKPTSERRVHKSSPYRIRYPSVNENAKVLADLRKLSAGPRIYNSNHPRSDGTLAAFAGSRPVDARLQNTAENRASCVLKRARDHVETDVNSEKALAIYEHAHRKRHWPEDSNQDTSLDGDIWLTSESDGDASRQHRRAPRRQERPPARQTSRSRVDSEGTISTLAQMPSIPNVGLQANKAVLDGSTGDDMETARTHLSPSGAFSPSSSEVRNLFPRTSSLSPKKTKTTPTPRRTVLKEPAEPLREISLNSVPTKHDKSPWARAKAQTNKKARHSIRSERANGRNIDVQPHCSICLPTRSRVLELEGELGRLKGEVITLKAILRRNGVQLPLSVR